MELVENGFHFLVFEVVGMLVVGGGSGVGAVDGLREGLKGQFAKIGFNLLGLLFEFFIFEFLVLEQMLINFHLIGDGGDLSRVAVVLVDHGLVLDVEFETFVLEVVPLLHHNVESRGEFVVHEFVLQHFCEFIE